MTFKAKYCSSVGLAIIGLAIYLPLLGYCPFSLGQDEFGPDHPRVRDMIDKGVKYLSDPGLYRQRDKPSYDVLMGYAVYKATEDKTHPLVQRAIPLAQRASRQIAANGDITKFDEVLYEAAICGMLLSSVDSLKYAQELVDIRDFIYSRQKIDGAFGYMDSNHARSGDVSQIQYVSLVLWTFKQSNIDVSLPVLEKLNVWLQQAQRSDGSWTYQTPGGGISNSSNARGWFVCGADIG